MEKPIKLTYNDVEILYVEGLNRWEFFLRGRERHAESLAKAKEAIDRPEPKDKKPFTPVECHFKDRYREGWKIVTVTAIAEGPAWRSSAMVWIKDGGNRSKESADCLFPVCPENDALVAEWSARQKEITALQSKQEKTYEKLTAIPLPKETP